MSIQTEIDRINMGVTAAYNVLEGMGATMPEEQNVDNLAATISSICADSVRYSEQSLTDEQKAQARENIGAQAAMDVVDLSAQVTLNYPDNTRMQLRDCKRYGRMCTFTLQMFVDVAITDQAYGFTIATLPVSPVGRVWINNGTQFYMDAGSTGKINVNNYSLAAGNYLMTGFFFINE